VDLDHNRRRVLRRVSCSRGEHVAAGFGGAATAKGALTLSSRNRLVGPGLITLALAIGLAGVPLGCGGSTGSSPDGKEKVPAAVEEMKKLMKERAASLKAQKGGAPGRR
jgi:hypothetical protein